MPQLTRRARKDLDGLPRLSRTGPANSSGRLDDEPHQPKKPIGPLQGKRSARLGRSHRIIYTETETGIVVLTIAARKDAYR